MGSKSGLLSMFESFYQQGAVQLARAVAPEVAPLIARLSPSASTGIGLAFPTGGLSLLLLGDPRKKGFDLFASARSSPSSTPAPSSGPSASKPAGSDLFGSIDKIQRNVDQAQKLAKLFGVGASAPPAAPSS